MDFRELDLLEYKVNNSLKNKIQKAQELIFEASKGKEKISLSFSGGKDSQAALMLLLSVGIKPEIVWFNSGYEYPETKPFIYNLVEKYQLQIREIKPDIDPLQAKIEAGFFDLIEINKINSKILKPWWSTNKEYDLVLTGIRASENATRKKMLGKNGPYFFNKSYNSYACYPVAYFQNREIFAYLANCGVDIHPIYLKAKTLKEREYIRVNWYIFSIGERGYYIFLRREYPNIFNELAQKVPEVRLYV